MNVEIPIELSAPIETEARRKGIAPQRWVIERIAQEIEDLEDVRDAERALGALKSGKTRTYTSAEVKRALGL